jgi:hypothetical protein
VERNTPTLVVEGMKATAPSLSFSVYGCSLEPLGPGGEKRLSAAEDPERISAATSEVGAT